MTSGTKTTRTRKADDTDAAAEAVDTAPAKKAPAKKPAAAKKAPAKKAAAKKTPAKARKAS